MIHIESLRPQDAAAAAQLHLEGQQGTFLSDLGLGFLTVLYAEIVQSPVGFGFIARRDGDIVGMITGTESTSCLFRHLLWRRWPRLLPPVLRRLVQKPGLLLKVFRTLTYPSEEKEMGLVEPELLFIGLRESQRGQGLGRDLLRSLYEEGERRGLPGFKVLVDASNEVANAFYQRYGFVPRGSSVLYGRPMNWYEVSLPVPPSVFARGSG